METDNFMQNLFKGLLAALVATIVLSALMVGKSMMGVMPALDLPMMIAGTMGRPDMPVVGWGVHFMIGVVGYGAAMALLDAHLPGDSHVMHGVMVGVIGWLVMMVMLMPMMGVGMFGMGMGVMAPMMTLVLHLIFGAVLGWTYGASNPARPAHA